MGGKDDDSRSDLDKWIETQRAEMVKLRDELLGERNDIERDIRGWTDEASPSPKGLFERFKGLVDNNFSILSEGFRNFPSNISELRAKMQQERQARREEEHEIWRRWTGSEDSLDHIRMQVDRSPAEERQAAEDATYMLLREAYERNKHVSAEKIINLYRDHDWSFGGLDKFANPMLSWGGACYYKPETIENLPSTARWGWPSPRHQWLSIDWFKRSPYSPIRLEAHPELCIAETKWRAAFEDLLSATLDKPMISEEKVGQKIPHGKPQSTFFGPGLDWMLSLQCRGLLPPQLPSLYKPVSLFDGFDEVRRPRTAEFMHDIDQVTSSKSAAIYPLIQKDLNLLIDEISVKSGPVNEAKPIPIAVAPWRVPSTEQELYEEWPPLAEPLGPWVPIMTGNRYEDLDEAEEALWVALESKDTDTAAKCLDAYFNAHGNVGDILEDAIEEHTETISKEHSWLPVLHEALKRSSLPDSNVYKRNALSSTARFIEQDDQTTATERRNARKSIEHMDAVALEIPRKKQQGLEEAEEKRLLTKKDDALHLKRPDVLSQLTTTQTTRLPDGTVTTKVVLKQKFADGREEEHETVRTTHKQTTESQEQMSREGQQPNDRKKNGWFWS